MTLRAGRVLRPVGATARQLVNLLEGALQGDCRRESSGNLRILETVRLTGISVVRVPSTSAPAVNGSRGESLVRFNAEDFRS